MLKTAPWIAWIVVYWSLVFGLKVRFLAFGLERALDIENDTAEEDITDVLVVLICI